ncbi:high affinity copper uptake protein 1 [Drosophila grimshawi]|uniref:Copper transport protein n=1 Tax=Drosophila grimshawi TaxID=7222 RepID=B4JV84_DROGR|nr:high affinity copper uptake protein 1 [Drosophila grimshawi]EDV91404.1 GH14206 [Drosophila grimshawi]
MDHGSGGTTAKSCPMIMVFHGGHCERILWRGWVASTVVEFTFSAIAFFVLAFIYELLKFLRNYLLQREARKVAEQTAAEIRRKREINDCAGCSETPLAEIREETYWQRIFNSAHIIQSLLYLVQVIISYLLMLVFMNFNYWLCLAVVLGLAAGYFFFGCFKKDAQDSDCCP